MAPESNDTPEAAVLRGFPRGAVRVIASREAGDAAYVLLDTLPAGWHYLYGVHCERVDGHWVEGSSSNGSGWTLVGPADDLGTLTLWDEVAPDADRARARFADEEYETEVQNGVFLFVWWNVPCPESPDSPWLKALRVAGRWVSPTPGWKSR